MDKQLAEEKQNFTELWNEAYRLVAAYTSSLVTDHHQAEDVMSRIAVTVIKKFQQYDPTRSFEAWAMGIARFEILKFRRERARDRHFFAQDMLETIGDRCAAIFNEQTAQQRAHDESLLKECLKQVKGRGAQAMTMCYSENLRAEEIGQRLKMTAGAVRTMLHRVRGSVRRCIEQKKNEARIK